MAKKRIGVEVKMIKLPRFELLPVKVLDNLGKAGARSVVQNIRKRQQADGSALQRNLPNTIDIKRKKGRGTRSLVDRLHRFVQRGRNSFTWVRSRNQVTIIPATNELRNLSQWQQEGGYTGWFGINKEAVVEMKGVIRKYIKDEFKKVASR